MNIQGIPTVGQACPQRTNSLCEINLRWCTELGCHLLRGFTLNVPFLQKSSRSLLYYIRSWIAICQIGLCWKFLYCLRFLNGFDEIINVRRQRDIFRGLHFPTISMVDSSDNLTEMRNKFFNNSFIICTTVCKVHELRTKKNRPNDFCRIPVFARITKPFPIIDGDIGIGLIFLLAGYLIPVLSLLTGRIRNIGSSRPENRGCLASVSLSCFVSSSALHVWSNTGRGLEFFLANLQIWKLMEPLMKLKREGRK